jgi:predicted GNAT family acetyltransferase
MAPRLRGTDGGYGAAVIDDAHITHDADAGRYEIFVGGVRGGFAEYELDGSTMVFTHTLTSPQLRGRGLAARVVRFALDDARQSGRTVVPQCWFVAQFIDEHPEYADLLGPSAAG